mmetsp:Transcript_14059/g.33710  ORF Transcript_14059/g.33710 Transcript_14059/m.33710 type:complete len:134 (+) Transcript_14059:497-898(+)
MRVEKPFVYDEELQAAHDKRIGLWSMEFPGLVTTECTLAFKVYFCLLSFPRCEEDAENPGVFLEIPLCFDFCVSSHMACIGDPTLSAAACDQAVTLGRVAPPRGDVMCVSRGAGRLVVAWVFVFVAAVMLLAT